MELTLFLPGLLLPESVLADTVFDLDAPALAWMLGRSKRQEPPADWLAATFGTHAPLPAAALRKVGAGGTASGDWLCLDPVHWQVAREGITLGDPAQLGLDEKNATHLLASIGPLFADWGTLSASSPSCWELQLARPLALITCPLPEAIGLQIDPGLPDGNDGREWRRLLAEAQTILHAHPVNRSRELLKQPLINSLWAWGAGCLPASPQTRFTVAWTDDPLIGGLASHASIPCLSPPDRFQPASGHVLAVVNHLLSPARMRDALAWREALLAVERDWFAPVCNAVKKREITQLHIVGAATGPTPKRVGFKLETGDLLRFWRRPRPLSALQ